MMQIKVSVIIPVHNAGDYLKESLTCVINQTLQEIEIICVDDGSTDNSLEILKEFEKKDNRIIVLQQENLYAGVARNAGLAIARGEFLSFLDADDIFDSSMLENAYKQACRTGAECVIWNGQYLDNVTKEILAPLFEENFFKYNGLVYTEKFNEQIFNITCSATWNKMFSRKIVEQNNIYFQSLKRTNDLFFVFLAMAHSKKIYILNQTLMTIRANNPKSLQGSSNEDPTHIVKALIATKERLKEDELYTIYERSFVNVALRDCLIIMRRLRAEKGIAEFYVYLRTYGFLQLDLFDYGKDYFYDINDYERLMLIKQNEEYGQYFYALYEKERRKNIEYRRLYNAKKYWELPFQEMSDNENIILKKGKQIKESEMTNREINTFGIDKETQIVDLVRKSKDVIIYGAGAVGQGVVRYLLDNGVDKEWIQVVVTKLKEDNQMIYGCRVSEYDLLDDSYRKIPIVIAVMGDIQVEMRNHAIKDYDNIIMLSHDVCEEMIRYNVGMIRKEN